MTPAVAVVVSTYDRPALLTDLVMSLLAQDHPSYEVVIVDNGSAPSTATALESLGAHDSRGVLRPVRVEDNRGPARARNLGWRSTEAAVILFTDDDCRVEPDWVRKLTAPLEESGCDIVQGLTRPDGQDDVPMGPWDRTLRIRRWSGLFETCNIAYRRSVLEAMGGFDESFPVPAGEDTDLGLRAVASGARGCFTDAAIVEHTIWRQTFGQYLRDRLRSVHLVRIVKRHPELRQLLPFRIFWQRSHAKSAVGIVACVGAGFVHIALLPGLVAVWIIVKTRSVSGPVPRRLRVASLRLLAGVTEVAVMAVASARGRCLLL